MLRVRELRGELGAGPEALRAAAAKRLGLAPREILSLRVVKRAVDARKKNDVHFKYTVELTLRDEAALLRRLGNEPTVTAVTPWRDAAPPVVHPERRPVVVGAGPAGLFAAWWLARAGARPLLLERGLDVDSRAEAVGRFWGGGALDPECNAQFGEGGAGTFSDGKLTTGMKDPRTETVLRLFVRCGAPEDILWEAKPHIGTDRLRPTVRRLREEIVSLGGEVLFSARFCDYASEGGRLKSVSFTRNGLTETVEAGALILAVGHSARDVFALLEEKGVALLQKPFSMGLRIEHRQDWLDRAMYGGFAGHPALPAADYKLAVHLPNGRGVYTFCMCPGGQVVAAASEPGGLVTNGMSLYARDGENANAAVLVSVEPADFGGPGPLAGVELQRRLERAAFAAGGGDWRAPACCVGDFLAGRAASGFGSVRPSYAPGVRPVSPKEYLPPFIADSIREALPLFARKLRGFDGEEAVLTGVESRSSSPVRVPRGEDLCSVSLRGLYPCGEGAGYAGGIMSAAVDGLRCAEAALEALGKDVKK